MWSFITSKQKGTEITNVGSDSSILSIDTKNTGNIASTQVLTPKQILDEESKKFNLKFSTGEEDEEQESELERYVRLLFCLV